MKRDCNEDRTKQTNRDMHSYQDVVQSQRREALMPAIVAMFGIALQLLDINRDDLGKACAQSSGARLMEQRTLVQLQAEEHAKCRLGEHP